ncbi:hypothetical protein ILUMI_02583 [Ignelater luminosus]|uniref:Uncharacterized protein n=1 Tax=Ignelater luminosus TaxID=2038154 RepID=A0A8K0DI04_IGNLU|nr:hypothetical protein ILUMI_02583 [Ignelater luminosus]
MVGAEDVKNVTENVLLGYFNQKLLKLKSFTIWWTFSMLKATLNVKDNMDITRLVAFLKRKSDNYKPKKSKILKKKETETFLRETPDNKFLMTKVALIIGVCGACPRQELVQLKIININAIGSSLIIRTPDTKTNTFGKMPC